MVQPLGEFEFDTNRLLGTGSFAVVYGGQHATKKHIKVAVKIIMKKNLAKSPSSLEKEIKILKELTKLEHENVVHLYDCKETQHNVYLIMEYCNGGELGEYLKKKGCLSEDTIRIFFRQIANAVKALHAKNIVHRDLKPPNILLCHNCPNRDPAPSEITLKIADFGFARFLEEGTMATTLCGSPLYMAAEVIMSLKYGAKADLWSIGTIMYLCLTGKAPFSAATPQALKQYYEVNPNLQAKIPIETSPELKDLLCGLLRYDPKDRIEFDEFFNHPFFKQVPKKLALKNQRSNYEPAKSHQPSFAQNLPASPNTSPNTFGSPVHADATTLVGLKNYQLSNAAEEGDVLEDDDEDDFVIVESPDDKLTKSKESPNGGYYLSKLQNKENLIKEENLKQLKRLNEKTESNRQQKQQQHDNPQLDEKQSNLIKKNETYQLEPVPVPSQKEAFEKMKRSFNLKTSGSSLDMNAKENDLNSSNDSAQNSTSSKFMTDITQMSPPTVQFIIGTPPNSTFKHQMNTSRRRSQPFVCGSPTRADYRGSNQYLNCLAQELNSPLDQQSGNLNQNFQSPPASPILTNRNLRFNSTHLISPNRSPKTDFAARNFPLAQSPTPSFLPNNSSMSNIPTSLNHQIVRSGSLTSQENINQPANFKWMLRSGFNTSTANEGCSNKPFSTSSFANKLALTPTGNQFNFMHNFNHPHLHHPYHSGAHGGLNSPQSHSKNGTHFHYCSNQFLNSPSLYTNFYPMFNNFLTHASNDLNQQHEVPSLKEETLLEKEHNETLAKLNFIVALVECIINLAESRTNPVSVLTESTCKELPKDSYRKAEQLALYLRSLKLINSATNLSQTEISSGRLQLSTMVKNVLSQLTKLLKLCLSKCKQLCTNSALASASKKELESIIAEKLIYNYAIEMCQSAAVEELFGHPSECFAKYQTAQILLHSLSQQVINSDDKKLLNKYKEAVEKRLYVLQSQGIVFALESSNSLS